MYNITKIGYKATKEGIELIESVEHVADFVNVADNKRFSDAVQYYVFTQEKQDAKKKVSAIVDTKLSGEMPTEKQLEDAQGAQMVLSRLNVLMAGMVEPDAETFGALPNILAAHITGRGYYLPVVEIDKLLREYHGGLVDTADKITIDGTSQQTAITAIKQAVKKALSVYSTEKNTVYKKFSVNINNRAVVNLCAWMYADIVRDGETGLFMGKYQTDARKGTNYAPLQAYLQRLTMQIMQRGRADEEPTNKPQQTANKPSGITACDEEPTGPVTVASPDKSKKGKTQSK